MESKEQREAVFMTTVQKWGGSLGVRIPKHLADRFGVDHGSKVEVSANNEGIFIKPVKKTPTLEELMSQITEDNQHNEIDFGKPEGSEVW
ncbi:multidrug transporter MatE [Lentibacillus kapialis]|uniref:Multidrug transporter MatE n=1 Tax=Lentibacillus kapialis TaxID=340214 RepID=A0A917UY35_9BACI|nr:AbrB/MazE/SpoVT family DNA-binding domain-containing protein [Lentibacillus kapialis]GGJ94954.1 multidrug transporter MatE [Lentibacillus kapialis]